MAEILFADDEPHLAQFYRKNLEEAHQVHFCDDASKVVPMLLENPRIAAMVLDIMMPTPAGVLPYLTDEGQSTGIWLLEQIQQRVPCWPFPVMVLTNRNPDGITEKLREAAIPTRYVEVRQKVHTRAKDLTKVFGEHIARVHAEIGKVML